MNSRRDLIVLSADKNIEYALKGLFARPQSLGIRAIEADIRVHPERDPSCALRGVSFLSNFSSTYRHGLLIFDYEGSGEENLRAPQELQQALNDELLGSDWGDRARAIVLYPELEAWVWSDSPHVDTAAGWNGHQPSLRKWLIDRGLLQNAEVKPERPKEAFEAALREVRKPRSSSLYEQIAKNVSLNRCTDAAFLEFRSILRNWFPESV